MNKDILKKIVIPTIVLLLASGVVWANEQNAGKVYTMTNALSGNNVISYDRAADGGLVQSGNFATDGFGIGSSLGSQGSIILTEDKLLVVNSGSNDISVFDVKPDRLKLVDKVSSDGIEPISLTIHKNLVYVLNAGSSNIAGYILSPSGKLSPIPGSIKPLSASSVSPAEVSFNPDGNVLVVTEKSTKKIDTYTIKNNIPTGPNVQNSNGITPFGFAFDKRGILFVSEAATDALSSYSIKNGILNIISPSIPDFHIAPCWVVTTDKFVYTNNAHDGTISSYTENKNGEISLLDAVAGTPGLGNIDLALTNNNKFVYSLNSIPNTIVGFRINSDGSLTKVTSVSAPAGAVGLAAK